MKRRTIVLVLGAVACLSVGAAAFAPSQHLALTLGALEGAGFSEGQAWMLAFFNVEIDIATEVPELICQFPIRWPTKSYVCPYVGRIYPGDYDPCAPGAFFNDWAEHCLPFHCPGVRSAQGIDEVIQEWRLPSMEDAMHVKEGETSYEWLQRVGHMLHAMQDFYSHSNWIEVFHLDLGFDFNEIPSWTSFMKSQRGGKTNLILLAHAKGNAKEAERLYDLLDQNLKVENHSLYNKDSDDEDSGCYDDGSREYHRDVHEHAVVDFHNAAVAVAGADTYQIGLQIRANIANYPVNGTAIWNALFRCVEEMAAYDGRSYEDELDIYQSGIGRLKTYAGIWKKWH